MRNIIKTPVLVFTALLATSSSAVVADDLFDASNDKTRALSTPIPDTVVTNGVTKRRLGSLFRNDYVVADVSGGGGKGGIVDVKTNGVSAVTDGIAYITVNSGGGCDTAEVERVVREYDSSTVVPREADAIFKGTASVNPKRVGPYTWEMTTEWENFAEATNRLAHVFPSYGRCTGVCAGGYHGRNLDWNYDRGATVIIHSPAKEGKLGVIGISSGVVTDAMLSSNKWCDAYFGLPFEMSDGMNEAGVVIQQNVVQKATDTSTWPVDWHVTRPGCIIAFAVIRYALDRCTNAREAAELIRDRTFIPSEYAYDFHFLVSDTDTSYIVEDGRVYGPDTVATDVMTNFRIGGTHTNENGTVQWETVESYGIGLERYDSIRTNGYNNGRLDGIVKTMQSLWYTRAYEKTTSPYWYTEHCSPDTPNLTVDAARNRQYLFEDQVNSWYVDYTNEHHRLSADYRGGKTWQTVHTAIYDKDNLSLVLYTQEDKDSAKMFYLQYDGVYRIDRAIENTWSYIPYLEKYATNNYWAARLANYRAKRLEYWQGSVSNNVAKLVVNEYSDWIVSTNAAGSLNPPAVVSGGYVTFVPYTYSFFLPDGTTSTVAGVEGKTNIVASGVYDAAIKTRIDIYASRTWTGRHNDLGLAYADSVKSLTDSDKGYRIDADLTAIIPGEISAGISAKTVTSVKTKLATTNDIPQEASDIGALPDNEEDLSGMSSFSNAANRVLSGALDGTNSWKRGGNIDGSLSINGDSVATSNAVDTAIQDRAVTYTTNGVDYTEWTTGVSRVVLSPHGGGLSPVNFDITGSSDVELGYCGYDFKVSGIVDGRPQTFDLYTGSVYTEEGVLSATAMTNVEVTVIVDRTKPYKFPETANILKRTAIPHRVYTGTLVDRTPVSGSARLVSSGGVRAELDDINSAMSSKYERPDGGIATNDLAAGVRQSLLKADTSYQKPDSGIPESDLSVAFSNKIAGISTNVTMIYADDRTTAVGGDLSLHDSVATKWTCSYGAEYTYKQVFREDGSTYWKGFSRSSDGPMETDLEYGYRPSFAYNAWRARIYIPDNDPIDSYAAGSPDDTVISFGGPIGTLTKEDDVGILRRHGKIVPSYRKINGKPLTEDITITDGVPTNVIEDIAASVFVASNAYLKPLYTRVVNGNDEHIMHADMRYETANLVPHGFFRQAYIGVSGNYVTNELVWVEGGFKPGWGFNTWPTPFVYIYKEGDGYKYITNTGYEGGEPVSFSGEWQTMPYYNTPGMGPYIRKCMGTNYLQYVWRTNVTFQAITTSNMVEDIIAAYGGGITTNDVRNIATNVVADGLLLYDQFYTQKKRDYGDMTASTNWNFMGWNERGFWDPLYVVATNGIYGSTKWQLWSVIDGEATKISEVDHRDKTDLEIKFENVRYMGFEVIARRCSYEDGDRLATFKTISQGSVSPTAATNAAQTVVDKTIVSSNLCTVSAAESLVSPISNVVFNSETYFSVDDGSLALVRSNEVLFSSWYELTNYVNGVTSVSLYAGQIPFLAQGRAQTNIAVTLNFPKSGIASGDAGLRISAAADTVITELAVAGVSEDKISFKGTADWYKIGAGDSLLLFTKTAVTNGVIEIWCSKLVNEL